MPIISLFSGPGGMDIGFRKAGFIPIFAADSDKAAIETYNWNDRRGVARLLDLSTADLHELTRTIAAGANGIRPRGVIGGPPCQAFSVANVTKRKSDPRKKLLLKYAEILGVLNRRFDLDFFVLENVGGLKSKKHSRFLKKAISQLEQAGFRLFETELDAVAFGVAQNRRRVFIVGLNLTKFPLLQFTFPSGDSRNPKTVKEAISGLPKPALFERGLAKSRIPRHVNHWTMQPRSTKFKETPTDGGRSFRRLPWNKPSWTVAYGNREIHVHPAGSRRISIFEAMLLQGFPRSYELRGTFSEQVNQISNAVPPPLALAVAKQIRDLLYEYPKLIQAAVLAWHKKNQRIFCWRNNRTPYRVLIAEKLLQQTAANNLVTAAFHKIITQYPTIKSLSAADEGYIRNALQSLGFQYRAHELVKLAKYLVEHYGGRIPRTLNTLLRCPGLGDYSSRAILCFGFGDPAPLVDTNIGRLLSRLTGQKQPMGSNPARNRKLLATAAWLLPDDKSADYNFGLLDICSKICTVKQPRCNMCPLKSMCCSFQQLSAKRRSN